MGLCIDGLSAGVVQLRYAETNVTMASNRIYLTISEPTAENPNKTPKLAPRIEDYTITNSVKGGKTGRIEGVSSYMEYSLDGGKSWIEIKSYRIDGLGAGDVLLRYSETDKSLVSEAIKLTIKEVEKTANNSKPDVNSFKVKNATKGNKDGRIDGVKEGMEYSVNGGESWDLVHGTVIEGLGAGEVLIRYSQDRYLFQSEAVSVFISEEETPIQYEGDSLGDNDYKDDSTYVKTSDTANRSILYTVVLGMLSLYGLALSKLNFSKLKKVRVRK